jgi:phosphonate transport system substrate-binding protein
MSSDMYQPLINHIAKVTGKKVAFYLTTSYAAEVEAMISGFVDIARLGPTSYVIGYERDPNLEVFAMIYSKAGAIREAGAGYHGILITKKGSGLTSIDKLRGVSLALTDPSSTSGYLIPKVFFPGSALKGEPLESYFGKIIWAGRHDAAQLAVHEGRVDAAFTCDGCLEVPIKAGLVKKEWFNYLWKSDRVTTDPWCMRRNLKPELKEKIKEAFFSFKSGEVKDADKFWEASVAIKFVKAEDKGYDAVRKLYEAKKKLKKK